MYDITSLKVDFEFYFILIFEAILLLMESQEAHNSKLCPAVTSSVNSRK